MANGKKILIAEDEKALARALELKLTSAGFIISVAHDGEEALAKILAEKFDLVLLDLVMPKKDGFSVLENLKAKGNTTPVIVSSNLSQEEDFQKAKSLGAVDYFIKSDTPLSEIVNKITTHVT